MTTPNSVTSTRLLIAALALLWLAFGVTVAVGAHPSYGEAGILRWSMAGGALMASASLAVLAGQLRPHRPLTFWLAVALLASITVAGLFDQLGLADFVFLLITVVPLALLIRDRNWYLKPPEAAPS
jgi:hypothetical protein